MTEKTLTTAEFMAVYIITISNAERMVPSPMPITNSPNDPKIPFALLYRQKKQISCL